MGRTLNKFTRVYVNGYDMSGYTRSIGPLIQTYDTNNITCLTWEVQGALLNQPTLGIGTLNGVLDSNTGALHTLSTAGLDRKVMVAIGDQADPVNGVPVYMGEFPQAGYMSETGDQMVTVNMPFSMNTPSTGMLYENPWGKLLHAKGSETEANTATGVDFGAAGTKGGYLMYQIFSITGTGTVTISVDESSDNDDTDNFAALTGATSGAIATASAPTSGIIQLGKTAAIEQYLRWQIAFGGSATACTFALAFMMNK